MNPITKAIDNAFIALGSRLKASEGDFGIAVLPEEGDPRARAGQVIVIRGSNGFQIGWQFVCLCGTINSIEVLWTDRKLNCYGCKQEFCIRTLVEDLIRRQKFESNKLRGTNIKVSASIKPEEWDNAVANLPGLTPSTRNDRRKDILKQALGEDTNAGEVLYERSDLATSGFSDPCSTRRF